MAIEDGAWIMRGLDWDDPSRIQSWEELIGWIDEVGFLPLFKNEVGVNYQDYLTAVRIDKAKQLLAGEPMNISQVANAVGYGSARYFSKTFEAQTGIRPAEYRRLRMRRLEG